MTKRNGKLGALALLCYYVWTCDGFGTTPTFPVSYSKLVSGTSSFKGHRQLWAIPEKTAAFEKASAVLSCQETGSNKNSTDCSVLVAEEASAAEDEQGSRATEDSLEAPDTKKILSIAIPAIGIWLCGPLLSMIDTCSVGLLSGTIQQAALSPAVTVSDHSARLLSFLYAGTTNLIVLSQKEDQGRKDMPNTTRLFSNALQLSSIVGMGLGLILMASSRWLLRISIGNDALDPMIFSAASKYVGIRALGMPAAAVIGTAQAACLGLQDAKSAFKVFAIASIVNLVVDLLLVRHPHPWIGGVAGSAWATVLAQYFASWLFIRWLCASDGKKAKTKGDYVEHTKWSRFVNVRNLRRKADPAKLQNDNSRIEQSSHDRTNTKGFLAGRFGFREMLQWPAKDITKGFAPFVVPVTITQVGRCSPYAAMGHVVSSSFGTISMAANQIILSIFASLIPIADSLSLTAQSLVPGIVGGEQENDTRQSNNPRRSKVMQKTSLNLLKAAGLMGLVQASIVASIPWVGRFFTTDAAVLQMVNSIVPILLVVFMSHGIFCASEGILLGQRDLAYLGRMYGLYFVVLPYLMLRLKGAALAGNAAINLMSVWKVFLGYQMFRTSAWVGRVLWLQYKLHRKEGTSTSSIPRSKTSSVVV